MCSIYNLISGWAFQLMKLVENWILQCYLHGVAACYALLSLHHYVFNMLFGTRVEVRNRLYITLWYCNKSLISNFAYRDSSLNEFHSALENVTQSQWQEICTFLHKELKAISNPPDESTLPADKAMRYSSAVHLLDSYRMFISTMWLVSVVGWWYLYCYTPACLYCYTNRVND